MKSIDVKNLKLLRDGLLQNKSTIESHLEMRHFFSRKFGGEMHNISHYEEQCATHCCVLGWATTMNGLEALKYKLADGIIDFDAYVENTFNIDAASCLWQYLFAGEWTDYDNTFVGAIKRLENVINGVVDNDNAKQFVPFTLIN